MRDPVGAGILRRLRERGLGACARHPDPDTAGLLAALLFGDTSRLPRGLADLFTRTGTRHLLALSGLHVALLAVLLGVPLARAMAAIATFALHVVGARRSLGAAVPLALLARSSSPCPALAPRRAAPRSALACAALAPRLPAPRRPRALDLLGVALVIEVLVDPIAPARPGVQLLPRHGCARRGGARRARGSPPRSPASANQPRPRERKATQAPSTRALHLTVARILGLGTGASVVATIATLPVIWSVFGEASWAGIVLTTLAMPAVTALIAVRAVDRRPGPLPLRGPDLVHPWAGRAAHGVRPLPRDPARAPRSPALGERGCERPRDRSPPTGNGRAGRLAALAFGLLIAPLPIGAARPPGALEVHVMDVGDGTAIVARAPGASPLLVDAGSRDRSAVARAAAGWTPARARRRTAPDRADPRAQRSRAHLLLALSPLGAGWILPLPAVDGGRSLGPPAAQLTRASPAQRARRSRNGARTASRRRASPGGRASRGRSSRPSSCPTTGARVVLSGTPRPTDSSNSWSRAG